jgi:CRP-like cAMP-binding protein
MPRGGGALPPIILSPGRFGLIQTGLKAGHGAANQYQDLVLLDNNLEITRSSMHAEPHAAALPAVRCKKLDRILVRLAQDFQPFNQLSSERLAEVLNVVRLIELRTGELFQLSGGRDSDYLFVIEGQLELISNNTVRTLWPGEASGRHPVLLPAAPSTSTLLAREDSIVCHVERQIIDDLISWEAVIQDHADDSDAVRQRMELVRNSLVFRRLPWEAVEAAFERMQPVAVKAGQTVVQQGEQGDAFYIITSGRAEVWQCTMLDDEPRMIAELAEGDAFGCEALISGKTRSETVRMLEDGTLLTLGKDDFDWLISKQMIKSINAKVANTMKETGYRFIDVRYPEEFEYNHIPGATLIPLFELRQRMPELDPAQRYIIYCQSGSRSAVAALRLTQAGYDVQTLEGGIREWPYETQSLELV